MVGDIFQGDILVVIFIYVQDRVFDILFDAELFVQLIIDDTHQPIELVADLGGVGAVDDMVKGNVV